MLPEQGQKQPRLLKVQNLNELTLCPIPGTSGGGAVTSRGGFGVLRGSHKPEVLTLSGLRAAVGTWGRHAPLCWQGRRRCCCCTGAQCCHGCWRWSCCGCRCPTGTCRVSEFGLSSGRGCVPGGSHSSCSEPDPLPSFRSLCCGRN